MAHIVLIESKLTNSFEIIRQAALAGHRVTFVTSELRAYLKGTAAQRTDLRRAARVLEVADTSSAAALAPAVDALHREERIDAVLTLSEPHLVPTSETAARLGLRHARPEAARAARDKSLTREALRRAGVSQPRFRLADTAARAAAAAEELGFPVVVKPVDGSASINAAVLHDPRAVAAHAERILATSGYGRSVARRGGMLVEEFVAGPLISCETLTVDGTHHVLGITDRRLSPPPALAELGGCFPARVPGREKAEALCRAALDALGFDHGPAHTEIVLGAAGPVIIEVNGRLVGGLVPEMIDLALGGRVYLDVIALHLGERALDSVERARRPAGAACIRALYSETSGRLSAVEESPLLSDPRVKLFSLGVKPGDEVEALVSNRERLGFTIVLDRDPASADDLARRIFETTRLTVAPTPPRRSVVVVDRVGYDRYRRADGAPVLSPEAFRVALITRPGLGGQARAGECAEVIEADVNDDALVAELIRGVHRRAPLERIMAFSERFLLPIARLREELGVPGARPEAATLVRDKVAMKRRLRREGVPTPEFAPIRTPADARGLLARFGKIVLKPVDGMGSKGVYIVDSRDALDALEGAADFSRYEAEEFIEGDMFHVDAVVRGGRARLVSVSRYLRSTRSYLDGAPLLSVMEDGGPLRERLVEFHARVAGALGIEDSVTHLECFVRPDGRIVFCEIAGRAGGGAIVPSISAVYGVDLYEAMLRLELGEDPPAPAPRADVPCAGFIMFYPRPGAEEAAYEAPEGWVLHRKLKEEAGERRAVMAGDAAASFVVGGRTSREAAARLQELERRFSSARSAPRREEVPS